MYFLKLFHSAFLWFLHFPYFLLAFDLFNYSQQEINPNQTNQKNQIDSDSKLHTYLCKNESQTHDFTKNHKCAKKDKCVFFFNAGEHFCPDESRVQHDSTCYSNNAGRVINHVIWKVPIMCFDTARSISQLFFKSVLCIRTFGCSAQISKIGHFDLRVKKQTCGYVTVYTEGCTHTVVFSVHVPANCF